MKSNPHGKIILDISCRTFACCIMLHRIAVCLLVIRQGVMGNIGPKNVVTQHVQQKMGNRIMLPFSMQPRSSYKCTEAKLKTLPGLIAQQSTK